MTVRPALSVVVLNWNGRDDTLACVRSVLDAGYDALDVLVVDNGSRDGSVEAFETAWHDEPRVRILRNDTNLGYAGGNNEGIADVLARDPGHVLVLNNDTLVDPGALGAMVDALETDDRLAMVGPKVLEMDRPGHLGCSFDRVRLWCFGATPTTSGQMDRGQFDDRREMDVITGCAVLFRASALREVGAFDPDYFAYYEEVDLAFRMRRAGWRLGFVPSAIVRHEGGASTRGRSAIVHYYKLRNMILFMRKNARWWHFLTFLPIVALVSVQRIVFAVLRGDGAGVHAMLRALLWHVGVTRRWRPHAR